MNITDLNKLEQIILGTALMDRYAVPEILEEVTTEDVFTNQAHRCVFKAIQSIYSDGLDVDTITVFERLKRQKKL